MACFRASGHRPVSLLLVAAGAVLGLPACPSDSGPTPASNLARVEYGDLDYATRGILKDLGTREAERVRAALVAAGRLAKPPREVVEEVVRWFVLDRGDLGFDLEPDAEKAVRALGRFAVPVLLSYVRLEDLATDRKDHAHSFRPACDMLEELEGGAPVARARYAEMLVVVERKLEGATDPDERKDLEFQKTGLTYWIERLDRLARERGE